MGSHQVALCPPQGCTVRAGVTVQVPAGRQDVKENGPRGQVLRHASVRLGSSHLLQ
jgi:hypothetical protein